MSDSFFMRFPLRRRLDAGLHLGGAGGLQVLQPGRLTARQIEAGAPADLFVSANQAWMDHLEADGPGPMAQINFNTATTGDAKGFAIVYDASTTHGGSGGPVLNLDGEVVAVNAADKSVTTAFGDTHKADVLNVIPAQTAGKIAFDAGLTDVAGHAAAGHEDCVPLIAVALEAQQGVRGQAVEHLVEQLVRTSRISDFILVSNARFFDSFRSWAASVAGRFPDATFDVLNDGVWENENRLGTVRDLLFAVEQVGLREPVLVTAAGSLSPCA